MPGAEIDQDVHDRVSQPGDLPGERSEPVSGRCGKGREADFGDHRGRIHAARRRVLEDNGKLEQEKWIQVTPGTIINGQKKSRRWWKRYAGAFAPEILTGRCWEIFRSPI